MAFKEFINNLSPEDKDNFNYLYQIRGVGFINNIGSLLNEKEE